METQKRKSLRSKKIESAHDKLGRKLGYSPGMTASDRNYIDMKKWHPKMSRKEYDKNATLQSNSIREQKARLS